MEADVVIVGGGSGNGREVALQLARKGAHLVIADVDGTLVTREKVLTDRARDVVSRMRVAGIEFAITSGRPPRGMQMLIEPLALTTPIAAFNGGRSGSGGGFAE